MPKVAPFQSRLLSLVVLTVLCAAPLSVGQQSSPSQQPAPPGQKPEESQQPTETLKVNVNVVQLFFNVKDKHGALIPNLTKEDFEISEDKQPQTIKYFTA